MQKGSNKEILIHIGNNVRHARKAKGLTMEQVANEAEMEYRQLGRIERGEVNTTVLSLQKIAQVLTIELHLLFLPNPKR